MKIKFNQKSILSYSFKRNNFLNQSILSRFIELFIEYRHEQNEI